MAVSLSRLSRSAAGVCLALAAMTCACTLPRVRPVVAPQLARGEIRPRTIALLPPDLGVTVRDRKGRLRQDPVLNRALLQRIRSGLIASLERRGYQVTHALYPDGTADDLRGTPTRVTLMHPDDLYALRAEVAQATDGLAPGPRQVEVEVSSDLTRFLGAQTGADASLYARGWVYVAPGDSKAARVAKVIGITLLVAVVVGLVIILSMGKGGNGVGKALGGALKATGQAAVKAAAVAGRVAIRAAPRMLEVAAHMPPPCHRCDQGPPPPAPLPRLARGELKRSTVGIGITLVDNASGLVLWHGGQRFQIEPQGSGSVEQVIEHFLRELPQAGR